MTLIATYRYALPSCRSGYDLTLLWPGILNLRDDLDFAM
jgi:hypothetical protein